MPRSPRANWPSFTARCWENRPGNRNPQDRCVETCLAKEEDEAAKTYGNLMVDLRATNTKLVDRSRRILTELTGLSRTDAEQLLVASSGELKTAIVARLCRLSPEQARERLERSDGHLRRALEDEIE